MGTFYARCKIENPVDRTRSVVIPKLLIDTGSEYTWVSERTLEQIGIQREKKDLAFVLANGQEVTRSVGFAIIRLDKFFTIDEVVFAEKGDLLLLGARTLEGLNLTIDPRSKKLVAAGPLPAAFSRTHSTSLATGNVYRTGTASESPLAASSVTSAWPNPFALRSSIDDV